MSTGKQRLEDKHANKRQKVIKITEDFFEKRDGKGATGQNTSEKAKIGRLKRKNVILAGLNEHEREIFDAILEELKKVHKEDYENYLLTAASLAKLYAQQEDLEATIALDGPVAEDTNGRLYAHPAATLLQRVQTTIIRNLGALGLTLGKKQVKAQAEEQTFVSEFANFS